MLRNQSPLPTAQGTNALKQSHSHGGHLQGYAVWRYTPGHHCTLDQSTAQASSVEKREGPTTWAQLTVRVPHL